VPSKRRRSAAVRSLIYM